VTLPRRLAAEFAGTALLLAVVVGSGIMGERLAAGNAAITLLANSLATGLGLFVLIVVFMPISGAHFNPLVTAGTVIAREMTLREGAWFVAAQLVGSLLGVALANVMFDVTPLTLATKHRDSPGLLIGEVIATFGLLVTIFATKRRDSAIVAGAVAAFITAGYWFTSSTSFANPAVTLARAFTPTFTGIVLQDVPAFIAAQCVGAMFAYAFVRYVTNKPR
jgi:glycerol uptake facilitator-like aquaporin